MAGSPGAEGGDDDVGSLREAMAYRVKYRPEDPESSQAAVALGNVVCP